ncbi:hypothetical protein K474DRAFT_536162 [Panus rudis PR-1116 ss-1]|nr:hypothetical protein K474DRAFT_536162 [Panus rudis PR-1116 ss-1]
MSGILSCSDRLRKAKKPSERQLALLGGYTSPPANGQLHQDTHAAGPVAPVGATQPPPQAASPIVNVASSSSTSAANSQASSIQVPRQTSHHWQPNNYYRDTAQPALRQPQPATYYRPHAHVPTNNPGIPDSGSTKQPNDAAYAPTAARRPTSTRRLPQERDSPVTHRELNQPQPAHSAGGSGSHTLASSEANSISDLAGVIQRLLKIAAVCVVFSPMNLY